MCYELICDASDPFDPNSWFRIADPFQLSYPEKTCLVINARTFLPPSLKPHPPVGGRRLVKVLEMQRKYSVHIFLEESVNI